MRTALNLLLVAGLVAVASPVRAHLAEGTVTLDAAQEVPAPVGASASAGGTATLELEDDKTLTYELTVHDLTGPVLFGHIHEGARGVPGNIVLPLTLIDPTTFMGTTPPLTDEQIQKLLSGAYYLNVHTGANLGGEIRGQIENLEINQGTCSCRTLTRKAFLKCVNGEIKKLDKTQKKSDEVKALRKAVKKSACGLPKVPKKKPLACCLPINEVADIVSGKMCAPVKKDTQCTALGGELIAAASCLPTSPCSPPASPSGAFLDDGSF